MPGKVIFGHPGFNPDDISFRIIRRPAVVFSAAPLVQALLAQIVSEEAFVRDDGFSNANSARSHRSPVTEAEFFSNLPQKELRQRLGDRFLEEFFSVSQEQDFPLFCAELLELGNRLQGAGKLSEAAAVFSFLAFEGALTTPYLSIKGEDVRRKWTGEGSVFYRFPAAPKPSSRRWPTVALRLTAYFC